MPIPVNNMHFMKVYGWAGRLGHWLLPPRCVVCDAGAGPQGLCMACEAALPRSGPACPQCALPLPAGSDATVPCGQCLRRPPPLQAVRAAFVYAAPVDRLARRFKFHGDLAAGRALAATMARAAGDWPRPQALVPMPLHRSRLRARGYDQALELARPLARALALPCLPGLRRVRATEAQSGLDAARRRRNLHGAFAAAAPLPAHVALVDDVMTTGATVHAAARALRRAGVARVDAWVCARVP